MTSNSIPQRKRISLNTAKTTTSSQTPEKSAPEPNEIPIIPSTSKGTLYSERLAR